MTGGSGATGWRPLWAGWPAGWASPGVPDEPVHPGAADGVPGGAAGGDGRDAPVHSRRARLGGRARRAGGHCGLAGRPAGHHGECAMSAVLDLPDRTRAEGQEAAAVVPGRPAGPSPSTRLRRRLPLAGLAWRLVRGAPATAGLAWQQVRRAPATAGFLAAV